MYTTTKQIFPVDAPANRQFLLTVGVEPTHLVTPAGRSLDVYPLLVGQTVPLKSVCFHDDNAMDSDPLCANIRLKRLYYRDVDTGELSALDVSLLPEARFRNVMSAYWETLSVELSLDHVFPGESDAVTLTVKGQFERDKGTIQIGTAYVKLGSGDALKLVGFEVDAYRVTFVESVRRKVPETAAA